MTNTTGNGAAEYGALVLRLALGTMYIAHALLKVFVFTLPGTAAFFAGQGFPAWTAYVVVIAELLAGVALIAGLPGAARGARRHCRSWLARSPCICRMAGCSPRRMAAGNIPPS